MTPLSLHETYAMSPTEQIHAEITRRKSSPAFFLNENQYDFLQRTGLTSMQRQKEIFLFIRSNEDFTETERRTINVSAKTWTHIYENQEKLRSLHHVYFIQEQEYLLQHIVRPIEDIDTYARTSRINFMTELASLRTVPGRTRKMIK